MIRMTPDKQPRKQHPGGREGAGRGREPGLGGEEAGDRQHRHDDGEAGQQHGDAEQRVVPGRIGRQPGKAEPLLPPADEKA